MALQPNIDFSHAQARLSTGRTYHYIDQRPAGANECAYPLLCIHGFPDLWYGWKNQIHPWVAEGYRVIVPDMLGYGKTDMPSEASAYSTKRLCDDLVALLDHLEIKQAIVLGHDWGSFIASRLALWYPQRVIALVMLSVPYMPPLAENKSLEELVRRFPDFSYQVYFASEESTAEIEANLDLFFRLVFKTPADRNSFRWNNDIEGLRKRFADGTVPDGCMLSDEEFEYYISNFKRGMIGPLSYYRTRQVRFDEEKDGALPLKLGSDLPVLILYGTEDKTCSPEFLKNSPKFIDQLQVVSVPDVGHWIMLEAPQMVTETILRWLQSIPSLGVSMQS